MTSWTMHDKELANVLSLDPAKRYAYAIKRFVDLETFWSLRNDAGRVLMGDDGREVVPIWPHSRYAALFATGD